MKLLSTFILSTSAFSYQNQAGNPARPETCFAKDADIEYGKFIENTWRMLGVF